MDQPTQPSSQLMSNTALVRQTSSSAQHGGGGKRVWEKQIWAEWQAQLGKNKSTTG